MSKGQRFLEHMFPDKLSKKPINVRNMVLQTDSKVDNYFMHCCCPERAKHIRFTIKKVIYSEIN